MVCRGIAHASYQHRLYSWPFWFHDSIPLSARGGAAYDTPICNKISIVIFESLQTSTRMERAAKSRHEMGFPFYSFRNAKFSWAIGVENAVNSNRYALFSRDRAPVYKIIDLSMYPLDVRSTLMDKLILIIAVKYTSSRSPLAALEPNVGCRCGHLSNRNRIYHNFNTVLFRASPSWLSILVVRSSNRRVFVFKCCALLAKRT